MKIKDIFEGMMKRSDPYISGDKTGPRPTPVVNKTKLTPHAQKIEALAKKSNVDAVKVSKIWDEERDRIDSQHPNRWSIIMNNVKKRLNIS
jgi:hypothetical protein